MYLGDYLTSSIIYTSFTTISTAGAPTTLSGSPVVKVMKDDGTTQSTAGITLTVDIASTTGLNNVKIDTSADTSFYAAGHMFHIVVTTGTVSSQSIAGYVVAEFSLQYTLNATTLNMARQTKNLVLSKAT